MRRIRYGDVQVVITDAEMRRGDVEDLCRTRVEDKEDELQRDRHLGVRVDGEQITVGPAAAVAALPATWPPNVEPFLNDLPSRTRER